MKSFCRNNYCLKMVMLILLVQFSFYILFVIRRSWSIDLNKLLPNSNYYRLLKNDHNILENRLLKYLPTDDEKKLIDMSDFSYTIDNTTICGSSDVLLLVTVSSAPQNQLNRNAIRETWGRLDREVRIVFLLGEADTDDMNRAIKSEYMIHRDIIQGNFLDSYKNTTYKSTMGLKFGIYRCPSAKFLLKTDDDVFVNTPLLKNFLNNDLAKVSVNNKLFCNVNSARTPIRDPNGPLGKWYVSYEEWPEEYFPLYCSGWYFFMSMDVALNIYRHAQNSSFFWIDDVFLTGISARHIKKLEYVDMSKLTLSSMDIGTILQDGTGDRPYLLGAINMQANHIRNLWQQTLLKPAKESVFKNDTWVILGDPIN